MTAGAFRWQNVLSIVFLGVFACAFAFWAWERLPSISFAPSPAPAAAQTEILEQQIQQLQRRVAELEFQTERQREEIDYLTQDVATHRGAIVNLEGDVFDIRGY